MKVIFCVSIHNFLETINTISMKILLDKIMYQKELSIRQVSIVSGVSKSSVQECMNENSNPKIQTLEKLAQGLKCHITDLFESPVK